MSYEGGKGIKTGWQREHSIKFCFPPKPQKGTVKENRDKENRKVRKRTIKKFDSIKLTDMVSDLEDLELHQNPLPKLTVGRINPPRFLS